MILLRDISLPSPRDLLVLEMNRCSTSNFNKIAAACLAWPEGSRRWEAMRRWLK